MNEFYNEFRSFCSEHNPIHYPLIHTETSDCYVCLDVMGKFDPFDSVLTECCKLGWFHRNCLKKFALHSGYNLKCPLCGVDEFRETVKRLGIFVPDHSAVWEKFSQETILQKYKHCNAIDCDCPNGRDYENENEFKIYMCNNCAGFGVHRQCGNIDNSNVCFECSQCTQILYDQSLDNRSDRSDDSEFDEVSILDRNIVESQYVDIEENIHCINLLSSSSDEDEKQVNNEMQYTMPKPIPIKVPKKSGFFPKKDVMRRAEMSDCNVCELLSQSYRDICEDEGLD